MLQKLQELKMCQGCVRDFGKYFFSYWTNKDITGQTRNIPLTPSPDIYSDRT